MKRRERSDQDAEGDPLLVGDDGGARPEKEEGVPLTKSRRTIVMEPLLLLYALTGLPVATLRQLYLYEKIASDMGIDLRNLSGHGSSDCLVNTSDPGYIAREKVQAENTQWHIYISAVQFLPSVVATLVYGSLSDRFGRRFAIIAPVIGNILAIMFQMCIVYYDLPVWCFLISAFEYLFGGVFLIMTMVFAYAADTIPQEQRAVRMTILDSLMLVVAAIGHLVVGHLIAAVGYFYTFGFCLCGKLVTLTYAVCCVPETIERQPEDSRGLGESCKHILSNVVRGIKLYIVDNGTNRRLQLNLLLLAYFLSEVISFASILTLFEMNAPLCWNSIFIGYFGAISDVILCFGMVGAAIILKKYLSEQWLIVISVTSGLVYYIYLAFVKSTLMMFFSPLFGSVFYLFLPITRSVMSKLVDQDEQGSLFAAMMVVSNTAILFSSLTSNKIYRATLLINEGFIFLVGAGTKTLSLLVLFFYIYKFRNRTSAIQSSPNEK